MTRRLIAVFALLGVVALATTASLERDQALSSSEVALICLMIAAGGVAALSLGVVTASGGYAMFGGSSRRTNLVIGAVIAGLLGFLVAIIVNADGSVRGRAPLTTSGEPSGRGNPYPRTLDGDGTNLISLTTAFGIGSALALVIAGAAIVYLTRRRATKQEPEVAETEAVALAIDESLSDLRRERDVRKAIIACYSRMERALERAGSPRRPAEAPLEYLARVLERMTDYASAAQTLTHLFERAKFSAEPMAESDKDLAIASLEALRAELRRT